jgi:prepilin peptidase CpaA
MNLLPLSGTLLAVGLAWLIAAAVADIKERLIYNELVLYVVGVGIMLRLVSTPGLLWLSLAGSAFLLVVLGVFARYGMIGGGDAKLIAASMLLLPPQHDAQLMLNIALAGGLLSCIYLLARIVLRRPALARIGPPNGRATDQYVGSFGGELARIRAGEPIPYAVAILGGAVYSILMEAISCISATSCLL